MCSTQPEIESSAAETFIVMINRLPSRFVTSTKGKFVTIFKLKVMKI